MRAMRYHGDGRGLVLETVEVPEPGPGQIRLAVTACGVCRTDLHLIDDELPHAVHPIVPGHEIVGRVEALGAGVTGFSPGDRVGVPWLGYTCGECGPCRRGLENLCDHARMTGYQIDGGYAEFTVADARYCFPLPDAYDDVEAAPLLCAGLIGYRALRMAGEAARIGLYGFGAAAHLVAQVARFEGREVFAFTRPGDAEAQRFARAQGCVWAGSSLERPPVALDAALIFAPDGRLVPMALRAVGKGGTVVCGGIHMSDIPGFPYRDLWEERVIRSVANLTRDDARGFLAIAPKVPVRCATQVFPLAEANEALARLRSGRITGAAVLRMR
ncbi:MAG: zinc-dependent alcohol dehydrogenase family protein [Myxococcota bacterium]